MKRKHQKAIVLGGSMSGLVAARALSNHFEEVTIIERDPLHDFPETRKGQPQAKHVHALLPSGLDILSGYFPNLKDELNSHGAIENDLGMVNNWYSYGGFKTRCEIGINAMTMSRQLLDLLVRKNTLAAPNISLMDQTTVEKLISNEGHQTVTGIEISGATGKQKIESDLIVDTSGRGSRTPKWLKAMGYPEPTESKVTINVTYKTARYERDPNDARSRDIIVYSPEAPNGKVGVMLLPIENNQWMLTLAGWHGADPLPDEGELLTFLKSLPHADFYDIVSQSKPITKFASFKFQNSLRRHYEKLNKFPGRYLVLGDAHVSLNPVYGQGMTSACLQGKALDEALQMDSLLNPKFSKAYFEKAAKIIDRCWKAATVEDFRYPETQGIKPMGVGLVNKYMTWVHKASMKDEVVYSEFLKVAGLLKPATALFSPKVMFRLIGANKA